MWFFFLFIVNSIVTKKISYNEIYGVAHINLVHNFFYHGSFIMYAS
jgi:hypothetical protein